MRRIFFVFALISSLIAIPNVSLARRGCCSHHGGVCGSTCCDGTALSPACGGTSYISPPSLPTPNGSSTNCGYKYYCSQMTSCEEAFYYYDNCGRTSLDVDGDGIPCESLCVGNSSSSSSENSQNSESCSITEFVDDDTAHFIINGTEKTVRLIGIDAPEKFYSSKLAKDAQRCGVTAQEIIELGEKASLHLENLLNQSISQLECKSYGEGYYGRILAMIYTSDGENINESLISDGYACTYDSEDLSSSELNEMNKLMLQAKDARRGLWGINYSLMACLCRESSSFSDWSAQLNSPIVLKYDEDLDKVPITLGTVANGGNQIGLSVHFPSFDKLVDIWIAIEVPTIGFFTIDEHNHLTREIRPWKIGISQEQSQTIIEQFKYCKNSQPLIPEGTYKVYWLIVPSNGGELIDFDNDYYELYWYELNLRCIDHCSNSLYAILHPNECMK